MYDGRIARKKAKRIEKIKVFVKEARGALIFGGVLFVSLGSFGISEIYEAKQKQIQYQKEEREAEQAYKKVLLELEEENEDKAYEDKTVNGIPQIDAEWYKQNDASKKDYSCKYIRTGQKVKADTTNSDTYLNTLECTDEHGYKSISYEEYEVNGTK